MNKLLTYKILASILAIGAISSNLPVDAYAASNLSNAPAAILLNSTNYIDNSANNDISGKKIVIEDKTINGNAIAANTENGNTAANEIIVDSSTINGYVAGGEAIGGSSNYNIVTISNSSVNMTDAADNPGLVAGAYSDKYDVIGNKVFIDTSKIEDVVIGGQTYADGTASDNSVNISSSNIGGIVYGAYSANGMVTNNNVTIDDSTINDTIYGGYSGNAGNSTNNHITINNSNIYGNVVGGKALIKNANYNTVNIANSNIYGELNDSNVIISGIVYGGYSEDGKTNGNKVFINNSNIEEMVFGGFSYQNTAAENFVKIDNSKIGIHVYGASSLQNADFNKVVINNSTVIGNVYGAYTINGNTSNNAVTIKGSSIYSPVYGGIAEGNGNSTSNIVTIIDSQTASNVYGGMTKGTGNASSNTVNIKNSIIPTVFGGNSDSGEIKGNIVNIYDSDVHFVGSGYLKSTGNISCNVVNINSGNIDVVYGGRAAKSGNISDNIININGGTIRSYIYGGWLEESGNITNNTIIISNDADITSANIYGGFSKNGTISANNLIIDGWAGTTNSINNFENIEFKNIKINNGAIINLTNDGEDKSDLSNVKNITITSFAGGQNFNAGDTLTLIKNPYKGFDNNATFNAAAGVAADVSGVIDQSGNDVVMKVNSVKLNKQTELVAQTRAASAAFVNQGTDLISDSLDVLSRDSNYGVKTFAAVHGNKSKYDVNSDIKINGWSTIVGVGNAAEFADGDNFSWGVFYENGSGNYRTYNSFNNEFFRGDGSLVYNGGGIAARYENNNGVYTEGSLRAGMLKSDMDNALRDASGNNYGYESESAYYGAHIGVGKIISLNESSDLDVYGKFFHTYVEGDSFNVAGDKFDFDSINSDRLRVGARITTNKENKFSTYYGLAYEYEFNGDADMKAQGINAPTQSLQGSSYMAELGLNYQPTPDSPWSFDLNLRGYTGERQGGSFNVQATYTF